MQVQPPPPWSRVETDEGMAGNSAITSWLGSSAPAAAHARQSGPNPESDLDQTRQPHTGNKRTRRRRLLTVQQRISSA